MTIPSKIVMGMALADAGWHPETDEDQVATGVLIGSGIGGIEGIVEAGYTLRDKGPRRISPFFIPGRLINLVSGQVSIRHKLRGPNHSVVTACSTGAHDQSLVQAEEDDRDDAADDRDGVEDGDIFRIGIDLIGRVEGRPSHREGISEGAHHRMQPRFAVRARIAGDRQ